ncbi:MAG: histidine phosphatase family protein [Candidatus Paceibacterota bacterium]
MATKKIYFIRHGETENNATNVRQGPEGGLSDIGRNQAESVALRLSEFPIEAIISSPYERASETAQIIAKSLNLVVEYSVLLKERRNPPEVKGKSKEDPEVKRIMEIIDRNLHSRYYRYSDEENFDDLAKRAEKLLEYIEQRPEEYIILVTHGIFLKMLISYMLYRDNLRVEDYEKLNYDNKVNNTSITYCEYNSEEKNTPTKGWKLVIWDDHHHLTEEK